LEDIFIAHITGMDAFARALVTADAILTKSPYRQFRAERYASFDSGEGAAFEQGALTLEDLRIIAHRSGEPTPKSGKQEWLESIINQYL
jgi:xylose isomerase